MCDACLEPPFRYMWFSGLVFNPRLYIPVYLTLLHKQSILTVLKGTHTMIGGGNNCHASPVLLYFVCYVFKLKCVSCCEYRSKIMTQM